MNSIGTRSPSVLFDLPPSGSRLLGEEFAPPRAVYLSHIPALLLLTGLITWIAGNDTAMVLAAAVGAAVALYMLWDWLLREGPTRFSTLLAMALLLGYGLGAVNTWLTLPRGGLSIAQYLGGDEGILARGMAAVLFASALLCFIGELYERPLFGQKFRIPLDQRTYLFIFSGTVAVVVGFFTHMIGFMGIVQGSAGEQQNPVSALISGMFPPLTALTIAVFLAVRERFVKLSIGACALVLCVLLMLTGRRSLIYTAMLVLFTLRLTGYRLKGTSLKKILLLAGLGSFLAVGVTVFMLLRLAGWQSHTTNTTLINRIQIAMSWVEDGSALDRATEANQANAQKRTFVLGFFADVLEGSTGHTPALGKDLAGYTSLAIPRVFNPDKDVYFTEEALVDSQFALTYGDSANSILTNGATDFGILGVLGYPLLLVLMYRFCMNVVSRFLPPLAVSFIALALLLSLLQTENHIEAYLDTIRSVIIFAFIFFMFSRLPAFRLQNR
ncbi:MAG TPA: hypothetical protein VE178_00030 [Silvibacterium sp.]|nr:hypothetical protein [Silvibacterium sp.]